MIAFVIFVWLLDALDCTLMFLSTLDMFFLPAVTYATKHTSPCSDWIARAQSLPESMCVWAVQGFFVMRVWRLSEHKNLTMLAFIPYLASYAFSFTQTVRSFQLRCNPNVPDLNPMLVYGALGSRMLSDGVIAATMCYMLYIRTTGFTRRTANTIKIVHGLILWSISTGMMMWILDVLFILSVPGIIQSGFAIFYVSGGLYVNAMLAQLNARARFRAMAEASIPLSSISLGETGETSSSEPAGADRELHSLDPA